MPVCARLQKMLVFKVDVKLLRKNLPIKHFVLCVNLHHARTYRSPHLLKENIFQLLHARVLFIYFPLGSIWYFCCSVILRINNVKTYYFLGLVEECSNCKGCKGPMEKCYEYDPNATEWRPRFAPNAIECKKANGIDCSGNYFSY